MLTIRMRRLGAKKRPFFRVVVTEARSARDGRSLEVLGYYDPTTQPETVQMNHERFQHWVTRGAQPSETVRTLLARHPENAEEDGAEGAGSATSEFPAGEAPPTDELSANDGTAATLVVPEEESADS